MCGFTVLPSELNQSFFLVYQKLNTTIHNRPSLSIPHARPDLPRHHPVTILDGSPYIRNCCPVTPSRPFLRYPPTCQCTASSDHQARPNCHCRNNNERYIYQNTLPPYRAFLTSHFGLQWSTLTPYHSHRHHGLYISQRMIPSTDHMVISCHHQANKSTTVLCNINVACLIHSHICTIRARITSSLSTKSLPFTVI